jgi:hypothetical protein
MLSSLDSQHSPACSHWITQGNVSFPLVFLTSPSRAFKNSRQENITGSRYLEELSRDDGKPLSL